MAKASTQYAGQQGITDANSLYDAIRFMIQQELAQFRTHFIAKVVAVHGGGVGPAPTVDVLPLVNQTDGLGNKTPHGTVFGLTVSRGQGGANVTINDPVVGDIGICSCADRDISTVKATAAQANPGSNRRGSFSDATYHGAVINTATPTNYINMNGGAITIVSPGTITMTTPLLHVNGPIEATGSITAGKGTGDQVTLQNHKHSNVINGPDQTDPPVPGT